MNAVKSVSHSPFRPELCQTSLKNTLDTPFKLKWPVLSSAAAQEIKMELERSLHGMKSAFSRTNERIGRKRSREVEKEGSISKEQDSDVVIAGAGLTLASDVLGSGITPASDVLGSGVVSKSYGSDTGMVSGSSSPPLKKFCKSEDRSKASIGGLITDFPQKKDSPTSMPISPKDRQKNTLEENQKSQLVVGLNAVTRLLEKGKLLTGLLCSSSPSLLHQHLLPLVVTRNVPFAAVPELSKTVSELLGIKRAMCLGLKIMDNGKDYFPLLTSVIGSRAPPPSLPWLVIKDTAPIPADRDSTTTNLPGMYSQVDKKCRSSGVVYYPLCVKKTVNVKRATKKVS